MTRASRIPKEAKPIGHVSPRRWMKYVARNPASSKTLASAAKRANKYLHASRSIS
jgi:hypothetical protein